MDELINIFCMVPPNICSYCPEKCWENWIWNLKLCFLIDNCSAYPDKELISSEGKVITKFLPNVTSIMQPMDQRVLVSIKNWYHRKILKCLFFVKMMVFQLQIFWREFICWKCVISLLQAGMLSRLEPCVCHGGRLF